MAASSSEGGGTELPWPCEAGTIAQPIWFEQRASDPTLELRDSDGVLLDLEMTTGRRSQSQRDSHARTSPRRVLFVWNLCLIASRRLRPQFWLNDTASGSGWSTYDVQWEHRRAELSWLVDVAFVTLVGLQFLDVLARLLDGLAALFQNNLAEGRVHILGHTACVTANKKLRALRIDPLPNLGRVLQHAVLDVDLLGLIA